MGRGGGGSHGGGGGRSGGGFSSGSRSSGHFSSGSSRSSYGGSRSRGGGSSFSRPSGGGYRPPSGGHRPPPPPPRYPHYGGQHYHVHHSCGYSRPAPVRSLISTVITILVVVSLFLFIGSIFASQSPVGITKSTIEREKLPSSFVSGIDLTDFYDDEVNWIDNSVALNRGLKYFYDMTGVAPYLVITDNINGEHDYSYIDSNIDDYANRLYDEKFNDEAHFLVIFCEYETSEWIVGYSLGNAVHTVLDAEALTIFADYISEYYYSDMSEADFFAESFKSTADRIMTVTKSPVPVIILSIVVLLAIVVLFKWWKVAKAQKKEEDARTERILNSNIEQINNSSLSDLEDKYL